MTTAAQNSKQILAQKGTAGTPSFSFLGGNTSGMYLAGTNQLGFSTAGVNAVTIDASQNVTITNALTIGSLVTPTVVGGTTASSSLTLKSTSGVGTSDSILFKVGNNGATTAMTVDTSGNVGIGTGLPSYKLTVQSTASGAGFERTIVRRTGDQTNFHRTSIVYNDSVSASGAFASYAGGIYHEQGGGYGVSGGLTFATNNANAGPITFAIVDTERMRIDTSGNVGIGTISPSGGLLDVNGGISNRGGTSSTVGYVALVRGDASHTGYMEFNNADTSRAGYCGYGSTSSLNLWSESATAALVLATNNTERMRIDSSGNVGIGAAANASAILDAQSTTKGVRFPNMTTTQKNAVSSPAAGLVVFDTTLAKLCVYSGSAWQTITSV